MNLRSEAFEKLNILDQIATIEKEHKAALDAIDAAQSPAERKEAKLRLKYIDDFVDEFAPPQPRQRRKVKKPVLVNAAQIAIEHPETFHRPDDYELSQLKKGQIVKVCDGGERFWVVVTKATHPMFVGEVNNMLMFTDDLHFGDLIAFHADNIYSTHKDVPARAV